MLILTLTGALEAFDIPLCHDARCRTTRQPSSSRRWIRHSNIKNFGLASAMAVVLLMMVLLFIVIQRKFLFRGGEIDDAAE